MKGEKKMKEKFKRVIFAIIIVALILVLGVVIKTGKLKKLEGYMYSFAAEITDSATDSNATSSNAQGCATSSDATSSNAQGCATSSDATSSNAQGCATSSDATSSDAKNDNTQVTETIKVTNTQTETKQETSTPQPKKEPEEVKTEINKTAETDLSYNNSEITPEILEKISNNTELQNITINLDENVNISREVFKAIKEKNIKLTINTGENQIIFDGNNIEITKDINAEISYNLVNKDLLLKEIVQEGVVINFANNGELPGTALIRIKATEELKQALDMDTILVYYYNEETKELTQMTDDAIYNGDGYIEFSISHNSKYLLVNKLIEEKEYSVTTTTGDVKEKVSFLESHKMYVIIIGVSILAIIVVVIILIVDKKVKNKNDNKSNNNSEKID